MTLIRGFRLEDIVLQLEMNTQLRERVNRNTVNLPPMLMCNICNTDDEGLSLSLFLLFGLSPPLNVSICLLYVSQLPAGKHLHASNHVHNSSSSEKKVTYRVVAHFTLICKNAKGH